jgi:hypothetical protein
MRLYLPAFVACLFSFSSWAAIHAELQTFALSGVTSWKMQATGTRASFHQVADASVKPIIDPDPRLDLRIVQDGLIWKAVNDQLKRVDKFDHIGLPNLKSTSSSSTGQTSTNQTSTNLPQPAQGKFSSYVSDAFIAGFSVKEFHCRAAGSPLIHGSTEARTLMVWIVPRSFAKKNRILTEWDVALQSGPYRLDGTMLPKACQKDFEKHKGVVLGWRYHSAIVTDFSIPGTSTMSNQGVLLNSLTEGPFDESKWEIPTSYQVANSIESPKVGSNLVPAANLDLKLEK